jgi:hypothetical protein
MATEFREDLNLCRNEGSPASRAREQGDQQIADESPI